MNLYTYSGQISYPTGAPTIQDIAISLSREGRYAGAGIYWWPVALHTFVVCDLLPPELKLHGLLHDASECITGDIPKPAKTREMVAMEVHLLRNIYDSFGLEDTTLDEDDLIHTADRRALHGEVHTVGTLALRGIYPRDQESEAWVWKYFNKYSVYDCVEAGGKVPKEFQRRFVEYKDLLRDPTTPG